MSLTVPALLLQKAQEGMVSEEEFYQCVKSSLPFAVDTIHALVHQADRSTEDMAEFAPRSLEPEKRGELLRAMASDAIKGMLTKRFGGHQGRGEGIIIAFQNCHKVGVFLNTEKGRAAYEKWSSVEAQILAQSPNLQDC